MTDSIKAATERTARAWNEAATGYDAYFAPRFAPYLGAAIGVLLGRRETLPSGAVLVPCVGPGRELYPLSRAFAERSILASDLSENMVLLAKRHSARASNVSVECADAMALPRPSGPVAALFSAFGLQLLPDPVQALASWLELLASSGLAVLLYWPRDTEPSGPFACMRQLIRSSGVSDGTWEQELLPSVPSDRARLILDQRIAFEIQYEDATTLWSALTRLGPLRALALARGPQFVDELGADFVAELGAGPLAHTPEARILLFERC